MASYFQGSSSYRCHVCLPQSHLPLVTREDAPHPGFGEPHVIAPYLCSPALVLQANSHMSTLSSDLQTARCSLLSHTPRRLARPVPQRSSYCRGQGAGKGSNSSRPTPSKLWEAIGDKKLKTIRKNVCLKS